MLYSALVIFCLLLSLFLLTNHLQLVLVVHHPELAILLLMEGRLFLYLGHGLHKGHAEGGALFSDSFNIEPELVLDPLKLNFQPANQVFQLAHLYLGVSAYPDPEGNLIFVVVPEPIVLVRKIPD